QGYCPPPVGPCAPVVATGQMPPMAPAPPAVVSYPPPLPYGPPVPYAMPQVYPTPVPTGQSGVVPTGQACCGGVASGQL
ncbi:MAG TPA: hypothetical protein VFT74_05075, partial [Isosphaeraceae bacterium]|nr:hypothetical protein [Isosphaeraceae bacterium]